MRRALTIAAVIALAGAAGVDAKPKAAKVASPAAPPAPSLPTSVDRFDIGQFEDLMNSFGWKAYIPGNGLAERYMSVTSPLGMPYVLDGVQCPDATSSSCEAVRLRYLNPLQHPSAASIARGINARQFFLRIRFQPDTRGGEPYLFPERTIILKGGVSPGQLKANLVEYDRWMIEVISGIGMHLPGSYTAPRPERAVAAAPPVPSGSGLMPGRYEMTMSNGNGSFSQSICLTPSDVRNPILKIAADMTNGGSGCSVSNGTGSATMQCTGRIVEGNISASGMSTSLRFSGNALIDTDSMGGRARIQFQGSASRSGDC